MPLPLWAPLAESVELEFENGTRIPLSRGERGLWTSDTPLPPHTKYGFRVNGQGPFPDPRSDYQPDGVHGYSMRWSDNYHFVHSDFRPRNWSEAVLYELHIGTFSQAGTFAGAIAHLDHLVELGITHIELMPLSAFPGHHGWGYDGVAPFAPHAAYGTPDDLKRLVDEAHARGLAVLLDIVFNHLGPDGNYLGLYAPYFTDHYKTPWGQAVNLDGADSDLVRRTLIDAALHWLSSYRMDGLRLDAVHALFDQSAVHFLEQLADEVRELARQEGRPLTLIAESDLNDPRYVRPVSKGGYGLDAHWCDDFHHALHAFFTQESDGYYTDFGHLEQLAKALRQGYVFDGVWSSYRRRNHGRSPTGIRQEQLVVCAQNHDQVGNRAQGERLTQLVSRGELFQIAALTLLSPFVPLLFQGEEWGTERPFLYFTDHRDPELARAVTEGRRREFRAFTAHHDAEIPDPQARSTFERSMLDWGEKDSMPGRELLAWYTTLIGLRHELRAQAAHEVRFNEEQRWLTCRLGNLTAFFNFSDRAQVVPGTQDIGEVLARYPKDAAPAPMPPHSTLIARL